MEVDAGVVVGKRDGMLKEVGAATLKDGVADENPPKVAAGGVVVENKLDAEGAPKVASVDQIYT